MAFLGGVRDGGRRGTLLNGAFSGDPSPYLRQFVKRSCGGGGGEKFFEGTYLTGRANIPCFPEATLNCSSRKCVSGESLLNFQNIWKTLEAALNPLTSAPTVTIHSGDLIIF